MLPLPVPVPNTDVQIVAVTHVKAPTVVDVVEPHHAREAARASVGRESATPVHLPGVAEVSALIHDGALVQHPVSPSGQNVRVERAARGQGEAQVRVSNQTRPALPRTDSPSPPPPLVTPPHHVAQSPAVKAHSQREIVEGPGPDESPDDDREVPHHVAIARAPAPVAHSLHSQQLPHTAALKADAAPEIEEKRDSRVRERILEVVQTMATGMTAGDPLVRMTLRQDILPGVTIEVQQTSAQLVVIFECSTQAALRMERWAPEIEKSLERRLGRKVTAGIRIVQASGDGGRA
jgi:hypothetical protein